MSGPASEDAGDDFAVSTTVANLRKIVEAARAQGIEVVLLTIPPNNALRSSRLARLRQTNTALIALGKADGITVVDVYTALASADGRLPGAYAAADGLHLSTRGEEIVAATIYAQLTAAPEPSPITVTAEVQPVPEQAEMFGPPPPTYAEKIEAAQSPDELRSIAEAMKNEFAGSVPKELIESWKTKRGSFK